ncbi:hypothetical protein [Photobacterium piscicola]|uniref:hypothetical protein n=1 Tax=Photobacterium piscicola TaxID=1378299 RepID=UPI002E182E23|nr:hypothetical protein [Photobacterium piscicola]
MLSCSTIQHQSETHDRIGGILKEQEFHLQHRFNVPVEDLYSDFIASSNTKLAASAANVIKDMQLSYEDTHIFYKKKNVNYAEVESAGTKNTRPLTFDKNHI